jgi:DNA polymerase I-like protein with 3'-5' exonuclease and polymerase domains
VQALTPEQLEKADRFGVFGTTLRDQFAALGEKAGFGPLAQFLGEDFKLREAQAKQAEAINIAVKLENELKVTITKDEQLIDQLMRQLIPKIREMEIAGIEALRIQRELAEAQSNRNQVGGSGGP